MQNSFIPYSGELLPLSFKYPKRYLDLSQGIDFPKGLVWWFEDANTEGGELSWKLRNKGKDWSHLADKDPLPFAQLNDWMAFFDGNDISGNPKVVVIDLGNKAISYELKSFDEWLVQALKDSGLEE